MLFRVVQAEWHQTGPRAGAVAFVQRFDSGMRLNVHFHVLWLDGVQAHELGSSYSPAPGCRSAPDRDSGRSITPRGLPIK